MRAAVFSSSSCWRPVAACPHRLGQQFQSRLRQVAALAHTGITPTPAETGFHQRNAHLNVPGAAYVHLPFCKRRCFYCDFSILAVGSRRAQSDGTLAKMQRYVDLVCSEIQATACLGSSPLTTVFFGGGTPSLVPPAMVQQLLESLRHRFGIDPAAEINMEADPGTFDLARLQQYVAVGITRVSIGVQSFDDEVLRTCGRSHTAHDVCTALEAVRACGVRSWSLDLMSGLPGVTPQSWDRTLRTAIAQQPHHLSVYDLQLEAGTPFQRWSELGRIQVPSESSAADMYRLASSLLTRAGYEHYEISNYALPGHRCAHNLVYWQLQPYYAFGMSAASFTQGRRFTRPKQLPAYADWVQQFVGGGSGVPGCELPAQGPEDTLLDYIMLALRLRDGLSMPRVVADFGQEAAHVLQTSLQRHAQAGLVQGRSADRVWTNDVQQAQAVRLVDPDGFLLSNDVISSVFADFSP